MNGYEKMREALEEARDALDTIMSTSCHNLREITASRAYRKCREALATPPRNCDVGTAEEQARRFYAYYSIHNPPSYAACLAWAQMPYAQEGGAQ